MKKLMLCMSLMSVFNVFAGERDFKDSAAWGVAERKKLDRVAGIVDSFEESLVKEYGPYYWAAVLNLERSRWMLENIIWSPYSVNHTEEVLPFAGTLLQLYTQGVWKYGCQLKAVSALGALSQNARMLLQLADKEKITMKRREYGVLKWFIAVGRHQAFAMIHDVTGQSS